MGLRLLDCWIESRWEHGCLSVVFVVCCEGSGPCDELVTRTEESTVCVCVCLIVRDLGASTIRRSKSELDCLARKNITENYPVSGSVEATGWAVYNQ